MAKKSGSTALAEQVNFGKLAGDDAAHAASMVGKGAELVAEENQRDLVNQLLGQAQAAAAFSQLSRTIGISKLAYVKETKVYKSMKGMVTNGSELSGTWEEFCGLLGVSVDKADTDIANLRAFGEEAMESMSRMGIGYRDLAQYRKLPADERSALIEAAKSGDKDQLLDLAESIMVKHAKEKADLEATAASLSEDVSSFKKREKNYEAELERSQLQIKRLSETKKRLTEFEPRTEEIRQECMALQEEACLPINSLRTLFDELVRESGTAPTEESKLRIEHAWIAAHIVAARAMDVLADLYRGTEDLDLPKRALGEHILTPEEASEWLLSKGMIQNKHEAAKAQRKEAAEAAKPRGRGRPAGSKNKAD